jgi:hypothetical protein
LMVLEHTLGNKIRQLMKEVLKMDWDMERVNGHQVKQNTLAAILKD